MKTRLGLFIAVLMLMPLTGFFLSGAQWSDLPPLLNQDDEAIAATLRTSMMLMFYILLVNHTIKRLTGKSPIDAQRSYFLAVALASAVLCWLLSYLNLFAGSWTVQQDYSTFVQFLLYTPLFALLAPAILVSRALFASLPGLLKALTFSRKFRTAAPETLARTLLPVALLGLAGGAVWPEKLYWLMWCAPLLLLVSMQFLWDESSIFTGIKSGNWGRVICTALSGITVGNLCVIIYQGNASLSINLPNMQLTQAGFALFGLTCLQLSDVLAENWRGKSRPVTVRRIIPIVVKK